MAKSKSNEIKASVKAVNAAKSAVTKSVNNDRRELANERKTTAAVIAFIASSDSDAAAHFRAFLNLAKNANKGARKCVAKWVEQRYIYVTRKVYVTSGCEDDEVNVQVDGVAPCNRNGKPYCDMMQAIAELRKVYEGTIAQRNEIARQMWLARVALISKGGYHERIDHVLNYTNRAPSKLQPQTVVGDTVMRK